VIALRKGGYLETVTEGTGVFFDAPDPAQIAAAVERFEASGIGSSPAAIRARIEPYFAPRFREQVKAIVDAELARHARR
jgi:hypothetical protein